MNKRIIKDPYRNSFSGPCFPEKSGYYIRIDKRLAEHLIYETDEEIYISTDRAFFFMPLTLSDDQTFASFIRSYEYYNIIRDSGKRAAFWVRIGNLSYDDYLALYNDYIVPARVRYSTIVKRYRKKAKLYEEKEGIKE